MKLYNAIYYHGSPNNFDKFDFKFMNKGQGAQAHGWGIYLAQEKEVSKSYRDSLSETKTVIIVDGEIVEPEDIASTLANLVTTDEISKRVYSIELADIVDNCIDGNHVMIDSIRLEGLNTKEKILKYLNIKLDNLKTRLEFYTLHAKDKNSQAIQGVRSAIQMLTKIIEWFTKHDWQRDENYRTGMLATVQVEDDCVFAVEKVGLAKQPEGVQNACENIASMFDKSFRIVSYGAWLSKISEMSYKMHTKIIDYFRDSDNPVVEGLYDIVGSEYEDEVRNRIANNLMNVWNKFDVPDNYLSMLDFSEFYSTLEVLTSQKEASILLLDNGVDGISYNGRQDGECLVLFNLDKCKIIAKE